MAKTRSEVAKLAAAKTVEERLQMFLTDGKGVVQLSKEELDQLDKMSFCDDQLRRMMTTKDVVVILQKKYKLSETTAYKLIHSTQTVFGSTSKFDKDYQRSVIADAIKSDMNRCRAEGDYASVTKLHGHLIKVLQLDKDDVAPPKAPPAPVIIFQFDPSLVGVKPDDHLLDRVNSALGIKSEEDFADYTEETDGDA